MSPAPPEPVDGLPASDSPPGTRNWTKSALLLAVAGIVAYIASLAASAPARLIRKHVSLPPQIVDISGTIWNGQLILQGNYEARWIFRPLRSLFGLSLAADWTLSGADTSVSGRAAIRRDLVTLADVEGRAGWGLVQIAMPDLPVACDGSVAMELSPVVISEARQGAAGTLRSGPATCLDSSTTPQQRIELPPLSAQSAMDDNGWSVNVTETAQPETSLVAVTVKDRVLAVTVRPEAAKWVKSLPTGGPITLEYPF